MELDYQRAGDSSQTRLLELESQLTLLDGQLTEARGLLEKRADYDEVSRELQVLRSIEFPVDDTGGATDNEQRDSHLPGLTHASTLADSPSVAGKEYEANGNKVPLERLLLNKNHLLQNQVTKLSVANDCLEGELRL